MSDTVLVYNGEPFIGGSCAKSPTKIIFLPPKGLSFSLATLKQS